MRTPFWYFTVFCLAASLTMSVKDVLGQSGGRYMFAFLQMPNNARQIALGGVNISSGRQDPNMMLANPALLADSLAGYLSANYYSYYAGISHNTLVYIHNFGALGDIGFAVQYLNYGEFDSYDLTGLSMGTVRAGDFAASATKSWQTNVFSFGTTLRFVQSTMGSFGASGAFLDIGTAFIHPEEDLIVGVTFKNIGFAFNTYLPGQSEPIPFDAQVGVSFKPENMPLRLSVTAHRIFTENLAYQDPSQLAATDPFGNSVDQSLSLADKLSRRFVIGGEFVISDHINLRAGYNFLRRRELTVDERPGLAGFSLGFMLHIRNIELAFSHATHHIAGGTNNLTLTVDTRSIFKKKLIVN